MWESLRKYRKAKQHTQKTLADMSGVSQSYICNLEMGYEKNPSLEVLTKLSKALGVTVAQLTEEMDTTTPARKLTQTNKRKKKEEPKEEVGGRTYDINNPEDLLAAYEETKSTRKAAQLLGVNQSTVVKRAKKYGIALRG